MIDGKMLSTKVSVKAYEVLTAIKFETGEYKKYILENAIFDYAKKKGVKV